MVRGSKLRAVGQRLICSQVPNDLIVKTKQYKNEILAWVKGQQKIYLGKILNTIVLGDCLDVMQKLPDNSIDLIVCDPPYSWKFMGKNWDKAVPSVEIWKECLRVLKPGAFAYIMSGPRQDGLEKIIANIRNAGFKIDLTSLYWTYATGFPKIHNIAKAVDRKNGKTGKVIGIKNNKINFSNSRKGDASFYDAAWQNKNYTDLEVTEPESEEAKKLKGAYASFQPKPAVEVILVVMKPLTEKSYTEQALANGKGCTWMDDCRIPYANENLPSRDLRKQKSSTSGQVPASTGDNWDGHSEGRFPANLIVSDDVLDDGKNHGGGGVGGRANHGRGKGYGFKPQGHNVPEIPKDEGCYSLFFSLDAWAERNLPYLIVPKASKAEKNAGLEGFEEKTVSDGRKSPIDNPFQRGVTLRKNDHPTVKPVRLMAYLVSMGSRQGDIILDPFAGSGTTCIAAKLLGRKYIGIEKDVASHEIAVARVENASLDVPVLKKAVADIKKHEKSREQQQDDDPVKAPEPCFFSNMPDDYWDELLKKD
jgi:site-specific DNA-methyltransferase (adenine-specific)